MTKNADYEKTLALFKSMTADILAPPPDLTVSEWADAFRKLSSEGSAEPGQWRTDRAPYQRGIMDSINDPDCEKVVIMSSAQVGKTEFLLNMAGYHIDYDPAPILLLQPTENLAKSFSKQRLAPMIRDTASIRSKVADVKTRNGGNTTLEKSFPGGYIALVGANAPSGLAGRSIRILLADEVDRFPVSAGSEGDPLSLAEKRTNNFYNRKKVFVSTPTTKGTSRIEAEFEGSTKEYYHLPCPSCDEPQPLSWKQITFDKKDLNETIYHYCKACGVMHTEYEWKSQKGTWIASCPEAPYRGFHLNELLSPWRKWREIVSDFLDAKKKGPEAMKVWVNTSLGETWEAEGQELDGDNLLNRLEEYNAPVPDGVKILTAAVDTQDNRFEIEVVGWGEGKESWGIDYHVIYGDLSQPQIWQELDEYLSRTWEKADGKKFGILCTCIDSGGHFTQEVYRFTKPREARRIYAIKGKAGGKGNYVPLIAGTSMPKPVKALLVSLGVDEGKSKVMSNLQIEEFGPNYCHFPKDRGYNEDYFKGLTAERLETRYENGIPYQVWKKIRARNEPLDLRVYNIAALEILNPNLEREYFVAGGVKKKRKRRTASKGVS
ncbi:phage terminase large subunit family protein [Cytobacillus firmus]|uniref:phage terminase large subunit family protein n=1 Tax=Cytobacillus firmus TaxID=1399 RepID=UPI001F506C04|nr:phage terminase large subunit family protein [Cytobacillus firmus]MBG9548397.1 terminase [Cytobacillus firmus]MBG9604511.1 terminase [Cytobacillus firmus]MED1942126.1 phage terminase large subunit family protein [Cytobacillus firmus]